LRRARAALLRRDELRGGNVHTGKVPGLRSRRSNLLRG
jgi:hypothetical protein